MNKILKCDKGVKELGDVIGFIGLGIMGMPMSKRLRETGYEVIVYDISSEPVEKLVEVGAKKSASPKDVACRSDVVISMLPTPTITKKVIFGEDGVNAGIRRGSVYIDMSTSDPLLTSHIAEVFEEKGVRTLDAPVSGGIKGAREGTLTIMVGGCRATFERVKDVLSCMGKNIMYTGRVGSAHTLKVINNMLLAMNMAATSEALALGVKAGIEPTMMRDIMSVSSGRSYALEVKVRDFVFPRNFAPGFTVDLLNKDIDIALNLGRRLGTPVLLGNSIRQLYESLVAKGQGGKDASIIITFFEEMMHTKKIKGKPS